MSDQITVFFAIPSDTKLLRVKANITLRQLKDKLYLILKVHEDILYLQYEGKSLGKNKDKMTLSQLGFRDN